MTRRLTLYGREECPLCERMARELAALPEASDVAVEHVDVDSDPVLSERLGDNIPVLMEGDREICRHRLDPTRVRAWLAQTQ